MFLYVFVFIFLALIVVFIGGLSFAIVGRGHRKLWAPIVLLEVAIWFLVARAMLSLADDGAESSKLASWNLALIFWALSLPAILWVSAWFFKRYREHGL